jgi:Ca2+/Na+ antiporter
MGKEPIREKSKEINKKTERKRAKEHEPQKNIPKEAIYRRWRFLAFAIFLFYVVSLPIFSLLGFNVIHISLVMIVFSIAIFVLTIIKTRSLSKRNTGFAALIILIFYFFLRDEKMGNLLGIMFLVFGIAWIIKKFEKKEVKNEEINKREFELFLEVAERLNSEGIIPLLFGSLGLSRIIGDFKKVGDIDIFLKKDVLNKKRDVINKALKEKGFELISKEKYEFEKEGVIISLGDIESLDIPINLRKIKISKEEGVKFYELSAENYLAFYQLMLKKRDRKKKRKEDRRKIELIEEYIDN